MRSESCIRASSAMPWLQVGGRSQKVAYIQGMIFVFGIRSLSLGFDYFNQNDYAYLNDDDYDIKRRKVLL